MTWRMLAALPQLKESIPAVDEPISPKRAAFVRLAERRTNAAMERIRVLGNLSNPYAYEYSDEDVKKIFSAIENELKLTRAKFNSQQKRRFQLG